MAPYWAKTTIMIVRIFFCIARNFWVPFKGSVWRESRTTSGFIPERNDGSPGEYVEEPTD